MEANKKERRLELMKKASESKIAKRLGRLRSLFVIEGGQGNGSEHRAGDSRPRPNDRER